MIATISGQMTVTPQDPANLQALFDFINAKGSPISDVQLDSTNGCIRFTVNETKDVS